MRAVLVFILVACGSAARPVATLDNRAPVVAKPKPVPCPAAAELANLARVAWGVSIEIEVALCIPFRRDGRSLWWLETSLPVPDGSYHLGRALVDEHGAVAWKAEQASMFPFMYNGAAEANEVDGDGKDELLYERTTGEGGMSLTELAVVFFEPDPLVMYVRLGGFGDGGDKTCEGSWSLVPGSRGKRIEVKRDGNACEPKDKHAIYERRGSGFVESAP
jgi:hypothetical protein